MVEAALTGHANEVPECPLSEPLLFEGGYSTGLRAVMDMVDLTLARTAVSAENSRFMAESSARKPSKSPRMQDVF
jgi:hypothetical protein